MTDGPFTLQVRAFADKAKANANEVVKTIIADVGARLVYRSPVDKGDFRRAWVYSVDAPDDVLGKSGFTATLERMPANALGRVHYIQNASPQGWVIEHGGYPNPPKHPTGKTAGGYSIQAPQGVVGLTVVEFDQIVRGAVQAVKS